MLVDLHNHSCLSPCGSLESSPLRMAQAARNKGIDIFALTDHNAVENLPAFAECCRALDICPVFGLEVSSIEEVHTLCLFGELEEALQFGRGIYQQLISLPNQPEKMGDQVFVDAEENILGELDKHLSSGSVALSLEELTQEVHRLSGLFIPAHIDRPSFSIKSQLGFLPQLSSQHFDAIEVMRSPCALNTAGIAEITGSDAHFLDDIGKRAWQIDLSEASFSALKQGLRLLAETAR